MQMHWHALARNLSHALAEHRATLSEFLLGILTPVPPQESQNPLVEDVLSAAPQITQALIDDPRTQEECFAVALEAVTQRCGKELIGLMKAGKAGWHFNAKDATPEQIENFDIKRLARKLQKKAPQLSQLLHNLLTVPRERMDRKNEVSKGSELGEIDAEDTEDEDEEDEDTAGERAVTTDDTDDMMTSERQTIIKSAVITSILMQHNNQKANWLQSICGIFLHANSTPKKVIDAIARFGMSVSYSSIQNALHSLSRHTAKTIRELGQTMTMQFCLDNFDLDLKPSVPTVQKSGDTLKHLTAGFMFPLPEGTKPEDMRCAQKLWENSPYNPKNTPPTSAELLEQFRAIQSIHRHLNFRDAEGLTASTRFNVWLLLHDLILHGPSEFRAYLPELEDPEILEQIPVSETTTTPLRATLDNNSEIAGNINAVLNFLQQAGIGLGEGDPATDSSADIDLDDFVILFHGDLGTGEKIEAAMEQRAIEALPFHRLQFIIFVLGLFHFKMACAEALWRVFIQPSAVREDSTSLMHDIGILRPKETGSIASKPGFRRMHQVIQHVGICRRLDLWRVAAKRWNTEYTSLEDFARAKPSFAELRAIARDITLNDVGMPMVLEDESDRPSEMRDQQFENSLLLNRYLMLYEENAYAMNHGDIMRTEACLLPWIDILKATRKHKYARFLVKHLYNVHFQYDDGLKRAIRYSMLINPTGKPDGFRAIDWCMELNNLYTKVIYGGVGSNHTVDRIVEESPLIQIFRDLHLIFERNLGLPHLTKRHAEPDMHLSFEDVLEHLKTTRAHERQPGRKTSCVINDRIAAAQDIYLVGQDPMEAQLQEVNANFEDEISLWDVAGEIEGL